MVNVPGHTESQLDALFNSTLENTVFAQRPLDTGDDEDDAARIRRRQERLRRKHAQGRDDLEEAEDEEELDPESLVREAKRNKRKKQPVREMGWLDDEEALVDVPARSSRQRKRRRKRDDVWTEDWDE